MTMERASKGRRLAEIDTPQLAAYEDGQSTVMCERKNPNAWIRSDTTVSLEDTVKAVPTEQSS